MSFPNPNPPPFPRLFSYTGEAGDSPRWPGWTRIPIGWRLLGLVLLCLIPRMWMACLVKSACHDGYYYMWVAASCREGNLAQAFSYLDLNIYPLILLGINSLGLEWAVGGKLFSVLISSLAVLPLFGWVRRLFCDQVAWSACFLYSLHAEFVEFSIEPIRDPPFWFLFNLCMYTTLRAISEMRFRWFLLGGMTFALAVHTRSEGWLLTIPFGMWLVRQLLVNAERRWSLAGGGLVWLAVTPLLIVLINITVLRHEAEWQYGRLTHFAVGWQWLMEHLGPDTIPEFVPQDPTAAATQTATNGNQPDPTFAISTPAPKISTKRYFKEMASALEQINLGLLVFGLCWLWRELWDWDRGALFVLSFALAGSIWVLYQHYGMMNGRYFYPIYLALMPYFGTGLLLVWNGLWAGARKLEWGWLKPEYTAIFIICLAIGLGWVDALTTSHTNRDREALVGEWLAETHGPFDCVVTDLESTRAGYHAKNTIPNVLHNWGSMEWQFAGEPYDLLVLSCKSTPTESRRLVEQAAHRLGLEPLAFPKGHFGENRYLVFVRRPQTPLRTADRR